MLAYKSTIKKGSTQNWVFFVFSLMSLGSFYPFVHNYIFFGDYKVIVSLLFMAVWFFWIVLSKKKLTFPNPVFSKIIFIQVLFLFFAGFLLNSASNYMVLFYLLLSWIFLFLILNSFNFLFFLKNFIRVNILMGFLSILGIVMFALGKLKLLGVYQYQGDAQIYNYGLLFLKRTSEISYQLRPAGYYDEPGSYAFVVMFLLLLNRKYFHNMKWEYLLIFLPLVTASLAHIVTIVIFAFLFYFNKKHITKIFFSLIFIYSLYFIVINFSNIKSVEYFKYRTFERVENIIGGGEDSSRQGGLDLGPEIFAEYPWGNSKEEVAQNYPSFVDEIFWGPLIYYGIFGVAFYFLPFIYFGAKSIRNKDIMGMLFLLVVCLNLLQRPYYMYPLFITLIYFLFFKREKHIKPIDRYY